MAVHGYVLDSAILDLLFEMETNTSLPVVRVLVECEKDKDP